MYRMKKFQDNILTILVMYTFALQPIFGAKAKKYLPEIYPPYIFLN